MSDQDSSPSYLISKKIHDKCSAVYNNALFGGVSWSRDSTKVVFIGEKPEPASYKNFWEDNDAQDEKARKAAGSNEEEKKKEEEKKPEEEVHYLDEKYKYSEDFGETQIGKKKPTIFIYNLRENIFEEVQGLQQDTTLYPATPMFDDKSEGVIFVGYDLPI